jgi:hypothetical protein
MLNTIEWSGINMYLIDHSPAQSTRDVLCAESTRLAQYFNPYKRA